MVYRENNIKISKIKKKLSFFIKFFLTFGFDGDIIQYEVNNIMDKYIRMFKWLLLIIGGTTFVLSVTLMPEVASWAAWRIPEIAYLEYPLLIFVWVTLIGFYYIIVLIFKICSNVQSDKAFTMGTVRLFDNIAYIAMGELVAYMIGFIVLAIWLMRAHPSFVFILFLVAFVCLMLFGFCKVMKHLLLRVIDIKEENDYTI